jgi:hypothetical protein
MYQHPTVFSSSRIISAQERSEAKKETESLQTSLSEVELEAALIGAYKKKTLN